MVSIELKKKINKKLTIITKIEKKQKKKRRENIFKKEKNGDTRNTMRLNATVSMISFRDGFFFFSFFFLSFFQSVYFLPSDKREIDFYRETNEQKCSWWFSSFFSFPQPRLL